MFSKRINPVSQIGILFEEVKPLVCTVQLGGAEIVAFAALDSLNVLWLTPKGFI